MKLPTEAGIITAFERLSPSTQTAVLIVLVGVILFAALVLDSGGEAASMYVTF